MKQDIEGDHIAHWLNAFIKSRILTTEHLLYQEIDAFLVEQLSQPDSVKNWENWPTLFSYCESLFELANRRGYRFYLGSKRFGLKNKRDTVASTNAYCNPGPSVTTLDSKKLPAVYNSGPHYNNLMLILNLLDSLDGIPCLKSPGVTKLLTVCHYDGMPLNIGTFPREEKGEIIFDGIIPPLSLLKMKELYRDGNAAVHRYLSENCQWISEVKEFDICDASGTLHVNLYTKFANSGGDAESVKEELKEALNHSSVCTNCLVTGNAETCTYQSLMEPCVRCKELNLMDESQCISMHCIHVSSDQASAQRRAHSELNKIANRNMSSQEYRLYGFGLLHFCISALRHYRLTDMSDTFYVGLLSAVWASSTSEAEEMKKHTPATVFSFRDAHSDEICYQTVSKELESVLKEIKAVVATLVPEQYKPTATEAKSHTIMGRPLYICRDANGDFIWTDAEYEFIGMGNRHIPAKCIALGKWDSPGPACEATVHASKAQFKHPAGIDVMIIQPGKNEVAFVCDKGNSCIRYIKGIHSFNAYKFVGTLKLTNVPSNWKPEGLAVTGSNTIVISEGSNIYMVSMDDTLTAGQVVPVDINGVLQSPRGICRANVTSDSILVADKHSVKIINLESKSVDTVVGGFKMAFDVAISESGVLAVTDVQAHTISCFKQEDGRYILETKIGTQTAGCMDGPANKAKLSEPTGICFDCDTAIFCCFGGETYGCIKLHTSVNFACQFMQKTRQIYDAIGFYPKHEQNRLAQSGELHNTPFIEGTQKLVDSVNFFESLIEDRQNFINISPAGPEGTVYHITVKGFSETVESLESHIQALETMGMDDVLAKFNLSAFTNEARKEHGFAKHKQSGQYRHPTKPQYCSSKSRHEVELIKKTCQCPHAYHSNNFSAYQPAHKSSLSSVDTIKQYRTWTASFHPTETEMTEKCKQDLKVARMLNVLTKAKPTQNVRDLYRYKCGYGPCVVFQKDTILQDAVTDYRLHYPAFDQLMSELQVRRDETRSQEHRRVQSDNYLFVPGDIVAINPGTDNGIPSADKWWLLQANKGHPTNKSGSGCHVFGFWLEEQTPEESDLTEHRQFRLLSAPVKVYYGSVIKDDKVPVVVPVEELSSGWNNRSVTYGFTEEYCSHLDLMSDKFRSHIIAIDEQDGSVSESEETEESDVENPAEVGQLQHEAEISVLNTRRRLITAPGGQTVTSYRDLATCTSRPRQNNQRMQVLGEVDLLAEAERNSPEFEK